MIFEIDPSKESMYFKIFYYPAVSVYLNLILILISGEQINELKNINTLISIFENDNDN